MRELNLSANTEAQKRVKEYLEQNVSDILADKINNGVKIEKDGKTLINKKTLDGFMKYATEEARKQAEKGANCACIEDSVVFGWAIHYFEEDSIEGTLYNEDGTEYKKPKPAPKKEAKTSKSTSTKTETKAPEELPQSSTSTTPQKETTPKPTAKKSKKNENPNQLSLFDLMG